MTPVHRRGRADAGRRSARRRRARRSPGSTNGTRLHVQGHGDQRRRHEPGLGRVERGHAARDDLRLRDARRRSTRGDTNAVELGVKFTADFAGTVTGIRFYKAAANTGTHVGSLWTRRRHAARAGDLHRARRPPAGSTSRFSSPVAVTAGTTYVASYFAPNGHYSVTGGGFSSAVDNPPLHALANATSANGVYALRRLERVPDQRATTPATTGSTCCSRPRRRPGRSTGVTATAGQASATVSWTAPSSGGPGDLVQDHAVHRLDRADAEDDHRHRRRRPSTTVTGSPRAPRTRSRCRRRTRAASGPESAASNAVTPHGAAAPGGADRRDGPGRLEVRARELDGAERRRRQRDHRLHRHAVRRRDARRPRRRSAPRRPRRASPG